MRLDTQAGIEESSSTLTTPLAALKADPGRIGLDSLQKEVAKLQLLRQLSLPDKLFERVSSKVLQTYRQRVAVEPPRGLRRHPAARRYTFLAAFCWLRSQEITDNLEEYPRIHQLNFSINTMAGFACLRSQPIPNRLT